MSYSKRAAKGFACVLILNMIAAVFGYLIRMLLGRRLSVYEFGLFYSIFAFVSLFTLFKNLGTGEAISKFIPELLIEKKYAKIKSMVRSMLGITLTSSSLVLVVITILSGFISRTYFGTMDAQVPLIVLGIAFVIQSFEITFASAFIGFQSVFYYALNTLLRNVFIFAFLLVLLGKMGVLAPVLAHLFAFIALAILGYFILTKRVFPQYSKHKIEPGFDVHKQLLIFGLPLTFALFAKTILAYTDTVTLTLFRSIEEVGYYNVAFPIATVIWYLSDAVALVVLPLASELHARKDHVQLKDLIQVIHKYLFVVIVPCMMMLVAFPEVFINMLFGYKYIAGANALRVLSIAALFYSMATVNLHFLIGVGQPKTNLTTVLCGALLNLVLDVLLVPEWGMVGAAAATAIAALAMLIMSTLYLSKHVKYKAQWQNWAKIFIAGVFSVGVMYYIKAGLVYNVWANIIIGGVVMVGIFSCLMLLLRVIDIEEIKRLVKMVLHKS